MISNFSVTLMLSSQFDTVVFITIDCSDECDDEGAHGCSSCMAWVKALLL